MLSYFKNKKSGNIPAKSYIVNGRLFYDYNSALYFLKRYAKPSLKNNVSMYVYKYNELQKVYVFKK